MRRLTLALALFSLTGCSTYVAARVEDLPVGKGVRVQVDDQTQLPQISGLSGNKVAGTLLRRDATELVIHVPVEIGSPIGQDLIIPTRNIVLGEVRTLNQPRTMLAVGMGVGLVVAAIMGTHHGGQQSQPIPDTHDPDAAFTARPGSPGTSIPFLRFAVP